jgi:hypothetical protein
MVVQNGKTLADIELFEQLPPDSLNPTEEKICFKKQFKEISI